MNLPWISRNSQFKMADETEAKRNAVSALIRCVPDFPKPGIIFRDICPLLKNPTVFSMAIDLLTEEVKKFADKVDVIVGLDARGFLFGPSIAVNLDAAFVPIRKEGKLPGKTAQLKSEKEYGKDILEMQLDAITSGQKVVIIDDLLATGGTMLASSELVKQQGGDLLGCVVLIELTDLNGVAKLPVKCQSILKY